VFADRVDPSVDPCEIEGDTFYSKEYSGIPGWAEGLSILIAVFVVASVTAGNNYSKEKQFRSLNSVKNNRSVKVVRGGVRKVVSTFDINVGEIVCLDTGDQVPADGVFIDGYDLETDESAITGESDSVKKNTTHPFLLSGCQVVSGVGRMLVTAVGENTEWGMTLAKLAEAENDETPLQKKLDKAATVIGYIGLATAIATFTALTVIWAVKVASCSHGHFKLSQLSALLDFFIMAITIVVVAVPEGLPLAVTISLAYSMRRMLKDNNLVRHLEACETMGGATNICSDKTGTLTENRMTVVQCFLAGQHYPTVPPPTEFDSSFLDLLCNGISINSTADISTHADGNKQFVGNKTECALLMLARGFGCKYETVRARAHIHKLYVFSSARKRMSTIIDLGGNRFRMYTKGASEVVLGLCSQISLANGEIEPLVDSKRSEVMSLIDTMASSGLRTLLLAYRNLNVDDRYKWEASPPEDDLILIGLVGITDPLRKEVPAAVAECKRAGIFVRMVTGDNINTAKRIGSECGIYTDGVAIEGAEFRKLTDQQLDALLPRLQVLARASPTDKHTLVKRLRVLGEVVAVTGDGTNDAPALKEADVGLAMNISGTDVAKEASDIVLMDDNFSSIVKAVMWGRCVYDNIRKFVQFQLTVNVVALVVAFVSAVAGMGRPLKPIQLLWVNMIMDTMGALALGTELPTQALLARKPYGRYDNLISPTMARNILGQSAYQLAMIFTLLFKGEWLFHSEIQSFYKPHYGPIFGEEYIPSIVVNTVLFNAFVFCQIFNEFNCRRLTGWNIFEGVFTNWLFSFIIAITVVTQALIVEFGGQWFDTIHLTWRLWMVCIFIGFGGIPWGMFLRTIPVPQPKADKSPAPPKPVVIRRQSMMGASTLASLKESLKESRSLRGDPVHVKHQASSNSITMDIITDKGIENRPVVLPPAYRPQTSNQHNGTHESMHVPLLPVQMLPS